MTDQTTEDDKATLYHASVKDFRAALVKAAAMYNATSKEYQPQVFGAAAKARETGETVKVPVAVGDAYRGSLMAYSYAYTLAAVIRYAGQHFGDEVAHGLACVADDLLTNGDDDNLNGDIPESAGC